MLSPLPLPTAPSGSAPADGPAPGAAPSPFQALPAPLRQALERRGFTRLTSVQRAVLDSEAARDLQISSQTGSGKTVALGLAMASRVLEAADDGRRGPTVLVIVPTRELAAQVGEELGWLFAGAPDVAIDCVTGGTAVWQEKKRLARKPRILVGTPGRLLDHLSSGALDLSDVRELVLDEADQMLDMGFREELEGILEKTAERERTHLVSATLPPAIQRLAQQYQTDPLAVEGTALGAANEDIEHIAYLVDARGRYDALVNLLLVLGGERTLLFVNTRAETAELAERLSADGFSAAPLSGELAQSQRTRTLASFRAGTVSILVATDVAARGLDVPDVETVIHGAPAFDAEVYIHRSGRTGRAGRKGRSVLLVPVRKERRVRHTLVGAGLDADWREVPDGPDVQRILRKRERRRMKALLESAAEPEEDVRGEARRLLEGRDPEEVVATLLAEVRPAAGVEPRSLGSFPTAEREGPRRSYDRGDRDERGGRGRGFVRPARRRHDRGDDGVRFTINWGVNEGATPKRILAHVCRRGGVVGKDVGAIRMDATHSTFEIAAGVARDFEEQVRPRDRRDPHLRIFRFRTSHRPFAAK